MEMLLNEIEMCLLYGLPSLHFSLYTKLRWRMGGEIRIVRTTYVGLRDDLYVAPVRGRHAAFSGSPSIADVREAIYDLVRVGLLEFITDGEWLVFNLPKACVSE